MAGRATQGAGRRARPQRCIAFVLPLIAAAVLAMVCIMWRAGSGEDGVALVQLGLLSFPRHWIVQRIVDKHFPGAMKGPEVFRKALKAIKPFGLTRDNTIYGQSISSDEINSDRGHVSTLMTRYYGRHFAMGGVGGVPYVGKTGFAAFSSHVPTDGHVFVLFGPHIGFSPTGEPGKFLRKGQEEVTPACAGALLALNQVNSGASIAADDSDVMQSWFRDRLAPSCPEIAKDAYPAVALAIKNYKVVEQEMANIINTDFGPGKLVLLGGIQINMPYPLPGYFFPLHFSVRAEGMQPVDLLSTMGVLRPAF